MSKELPASTGARSSPPTTRSCRALRAYLLVSQDQQRIEVHDRSESGQRQAFAYTAGDAIPVGWLGGDAVPIGRLYAGTDVA